MKCFVSPLKCFSSSTPGTTTDVPACMLTSGVNPVELWRPIPLPSSFSCCNYMQGIEHPEHPQRSASPARAVHRIFLPENSVKTFCEDLLFFPFSITSCLLLAHIHSSLRGLSSFYSGGGCNSSVMLLFLSLPFSSVLSFSFSLLFPCDLLVVVFPFSFARLTARSFSFSFFSSLRSPSTANTTISPDRV